MAIPAVYIGIVSNFADMYDRNLDYIAKTAKTDTEVVEETETEEQ